MKQINIFFFSILIMSVFTLIACSGGDNNEFFPNNTGSTTGNTTAEVKNRDLLACWSYQGTSPSIPSFQLMSDGKCYVYTNGGSSSNGTWAYDTKTKVLAISGYPSYALNVKLLTSNMLSAEWSSIKYGTRTDTWVVRPFLNLDSGWKKLILGKWIGKNGTIVFHNGKFVLEIQGKEKKVNISGSYSFGTIKYDNKNDMNSIILTSDSKINYTYESKYKRYDYITFYIPCLDGHVLSVYKSNDKYNNYITAIEDEYDDLFIGTYTYEKYN